MNVKPLSDDQALVAGAQQFEDLCNIETSSFPNLSDLAAASADYLAGLQAAIVLTATEWSARYGGDRALTLLRLGLLRNDFEKAEHLAATIRADTNSSLNARELTDEFLEEASATVSAYMALNNVKPFDDPKDFVIAYIQQRADLIEVNSLP